MRCASVFVVVAILSRLAFADGWTITNPEPNESFGAQSNVDGGGGRPETESPTLKVKIKKFSATVDNADATCTEGALWDAATMAVDGQNYPGDQQYKLYKLTGTELTELASQNIRVASPM